MALALSVSASAASAKVAAHRAHGVKASSKTFAVVFPAKRGRHVVRADAVGTERNGDGCLGVHLRGAFRGDGTPARPPARCPARRLRWRGLADIMAADPSAATALSLVGQKVDMKVCFSLHYVTKPGEDHHGSTSASATGTRTRAWP